MSKQQSLVDPARIRFIRKNGRIIPIRIKTDSRMHQAGVGIGLVTAGAATSAASGKVYRGLVRQSNRMARRAFEAGAKKGFSSPQLQMSLFEKTKHIKAGELASKLARKASHVGTAAAFTRRGGILAGSILIGLGAAKLASAAQKDENETVSRVIGTGAAALAFQSRGASKFLFQAGMYPKAAWREALKKAAPHILKFRKAF